MKPALYTIGAPEEAILRALNRYHYLTARQLTRLLYQPASLNYVQEHLKLLADNNFLHRRDLPRRQRHGTTPYVYTLAIKGRKVLEQLGIESVPVARRPSTIPVSELFLEHTIAVSDALISLEKLSYVEPRIQIASLLHERDLKRTPLSITVNGRRTAVSPDGFVEVIAFDLDGKKWREGVWLEVDRGTEEQPAWRRKIKAILAASAGPYQHHFGISVLTVAVVATTGALRRDTLRRWTEAELGADSEEADLFRFASGAAVEDAENLFLGPNWHRPFRKEAVPLFLLDDG